MKLQSFLCAAALALSAAVSATAGESGTLTISTVTGQTYQNCRVLKAYPHALAFAHSRGIAQVTFTQLAPEWREKYHYDEAAATAYVKKHTASPARQIAVGEAGRRAGWNGGHGGYDAGWGTTAGLGLDNRLGPALGWDGKRQRGGNGSGYGYGYGSGYPGTVYGYNPRTTVPSYLMFGGGRYPGYNAPGLIAPRTRSIAPASSFVTPIPRVGGATIRR